MALLFKRLVLEAQVAVIFVVLLLALAGALVRLTHAFVHESLSAALHHKGESSPIAAD
jgi:hypothetical protein